MGVRLIRHISLGTVLGLIFVALCLAFTLGATPAHADPPKLDPSIELTKDELLGDDNPSGDIVPAGISTTHNVIVITTGPSDTDLTLALDGPASCQPHWTVPADQFPYPEIFGELQVSVVTMSNVGAGTTNVQYSIQCAAVGTYSVQIVANVSSESMPIEVDPVPVDNQTENSVQANVTAPATETPVPSEAPTVTPTLTPTPTPTSTPSPTASPTFSPTPPPTAVPPTTAPTSTPAPESVSQTVSPGSTVTTDTENDGATPADSVETTITSPNGGSITIQESSGSGPSGYSLLGSQVLISAPPATAGNPLVITFVLDASVVPPGVGPADIVVFKNGAPLPGCTGSPGMASPDPCVSSRTVGPDGDITITALTSTASLWILAIPNSQPPVGGVVDQLIAHRAAQSGYLLVAGLGALLAMAVASAYAWKRAHGE